MRALPRPLTARERTLRKLTWPMRALVLVGAYLLTMEFVYANLPLYLGLPAGGLVAAGAVALEMWLTAKMTQRTFEDVAKWRMLVFDRLMAGHDQALVNRGLDSDRTQVGTTEVSEPFGELRADPDEQPVDTSYDFEGTATEETDK